MTITGISRLEIFSAIQYSTIWCDILTCTQKLTASQRNLCYRPKNRKNEKRDQKQKLTWLRSCGPGNSCYCC